MPHIYTKTKVMDKAYNLDIDSIEQKTICIDLNDKYTYSVSGNKIILTKKIELPKTIEEAYTVTLSEETYDTLYVLRQLLYVLEVYNVLTEYKPKVNSSAIVGWAILKENGKLQVKHVYDTNYLFLFKTREAASTFFEAFKEHLNRCIKYIV